MTQSCRAWGPHTAWPAARPRGVGAGPALPGRAALEAAAHPSAEKYLYFVSKMDGTGLSQFSHNLDEHNAAVRKYILKRE